MNFNTHYHLAGQHAFLSASKYHWVNYDEDKLISTFNKWMAARKGTELHEFASSAIKLGIKLPKTNKSLNLYVNDAIGFKMQTEQTLYYSDNCFGTADTISYRKNSLRIHDLKTGETPASIKQLEVYTALFCLEYNTKPNEIEIELRLYQSDQVLVHHPDPVDILGIMDKIIAFDKLIEKIKAANGIAGQTANGDLKKLLSVIQGG
jgi:hypothetical protein